jgi:hypothetical protein
MAASISDDSDDDDDNGTTGQGQSDTDDDEEPVVSETPAGDQQGSTVTLPTATSTPAPAGTMPSAVPAATGPAAAPEPFVFEQKGATKTILVGCALPFEGNQRVSVWCRTAAGSYQQLMTAVVLHATRACCLVLFCVAWSGASLVEFWSRLPEKRYTSQQATNYPEHCSSLLLLLSLLPQPCAYIVQQQVICGAILKAAIGWRCHYCDHSAEAAAVVCSCRHYGSHSTVIALGQARYHQHSFNCIAAAAGCW